MNARRRFLGTLALGGLGGCRAFTRAFDPMRPAAAEAAEPLAWREGLVPRRVGIVGDIQRTGLLERLVLGRRQNDAERVAVLGTIASERPDLLLSLGDQVISGGDADWAYFDAVMAPVREAGIPVLGMLGNHDYDGGDIPRAIANFCARFPHQRRRLHGLVSLGDVALVTVDSNADRLGEHAAAAQAERYRAMLARLDDDPAVRTVIVASHHPPFTNSNLDGGADLLRVRESFAVPFLASRKARLYLSGHVHSYERFIDRDGKSFVISGGGGGPRRAVDISDARPHTNDAYRLGTLRPFHFMMMEIHDDRLAFQVRMLRVDARGAWTFAVGDSFDVARG